VVSSPHADQLTIGIVKVEVGGELLIRWRTNEVTVSLFRGVSEEFGWHRRRSLRRRSSAHIKRRRDASSVDGGALDQNA
jgi:hypothetical protein